MAGSPGRIREGQAYGLLLAEVAGRPATFGRIWQWTHEHLQLPSGLFAYHANAAGQVLSRDRTFRGQVNPLQDLVAAHLNGT